MSYKITEYKIAFKLVWEPIFHKKEEEEKHAYFIAFKEPNPINNFY